MIDGFPGSIPERHRRWLSSSIDILARDGRIVGVGVGGSFLTDTMDEFSDLDLVIAVEPGDFGDVMAARHSIAQSLGPLLAAFTGEHVHEPRLLICLYDGVPVLHVDLKFVALPDLAKRVEDPAVLWDRDGRFAQALERGAAEYPMPDPQWIEDRFWIWLHFAAAKVGRGELFTALELLSFLRSTVLGPLALVGAGAQPSGVRRLEAMTPGQVDPLKATLATHDAADCLRALRASADAYRSLRSAGGAVEVRDAAEAAAMQYLADLEGR